MKSQWGYYPRHAPSFRLPCMQRTLRAILQSTLIKSGSPLYFSSGVFFTPINFIAIFMVYTMFDSKKTSHLPTAISLLLEGLAPSNIDILFAKDNKTYTTLLYGNGPGFQKYHDNEADYKNSHVRENLTSTYTGILISRQRYPATVSTKIRSNSY